MVTVFVKYNVLVESNHVQLDDYFVEKSKIVKVLKLTDLNDMFDNISKVEILKQT